MNLLSWYVLIVWIIVAVGFAGVFSKLSRIVELLESLLQELRSFKGKTEKNKDPATHI